MVAVFYQLVVRYWKVFEINLASTTVSGGISCSSAGAASGVPCN